MNLKAIIFSSCSTGAANRSVILNAVKIFALVLVSSLLLCSSVLAFHLTLEWDPNIDEDLAGYIVYYGIDSRNYKYEVDIGDITSCTISGLAEGEKYYFAVTAYDDEGNESAYSREIVYPNTSSEEVSHSNSFSGSSSSFDFQNSCFISSTADKHRSVVHLLAFVGGLLAGIFGLLIYRRRVFT